MTGTPEGLVSPPTGYQTTRPTPPTVWVFSCPNVPQTPVNIGDNMWSVGERKKSVYNCKD